MEPPNMKKATIGQMIEWADANTGKLKPKLRELADLIVSQKGFLERIKAFPWTARTWADKAWHDIQAIRVQEKLELETKPSYQPLTRISNLRRACRWLGLNLNKIDTGRFVITKSHTRPSTKPAALLMHERLRNHRRTETSHRNPRRRACESHG